MSITVLNTDAGLSGKTIVNTEDAQTVSGLKTFDRDPNPPFAVSSGSDVVANLDADKWDGLDAVDWTSFTPSWTNVTVGDGTSEGTYTRIGNVIHVITRLVFGSTTSFSGAVSVAPPVNLDTTYGIYSLNGVVMCLDTGGAVYLGVPTVASTTSVAPLHSIVSATLIANNSVTSTAPFTWATGDTLTITYTAKVA